MSLHAIEKGERPTYRIPGAVMSPVLGCVVVPWEVGHVIHWCHPDRDQALCGYGAWLLHSDDLRGAMIDCGLCHARAFGGGDWRELHGFPGDDS
jgi:hypothetical protein